MERADLEIKLAGLGDIIMLSRRKHYGGDSMWYLPQEWEVSRGRC